MARSRRPRIAKGPEKVRRASAQAAAERMRVRREAREAAKPPARAASVAREPEPDRQPGAARLLRDRVLDAAGGSTDALAQAWDRFERDFEQARFRSVGICAWASVRIDGGGADPGLAAVQAERRRREVSAVLREVGEPGASVLWHVVGMGESLSGWALRSGRNGRRIHPRIAKGVLIQALDSLAHTDTASPALVNTPAFSHQVVAVQKARAAYGRNARSLLCLSFTTCLASLINRLPHK